MDSTTIAAALLHDVVEDSNTSLDDIRRDFGAEVAELVDGLTKLSTLTFRSTAEEQAENYRKLLLSVAKDARVIIIKLADRLHNMRTLEHLDVEKQRRIALETREIYAPLAHRFGMAGVKAELEDLACKFLEPEDYRALARKVKPRKSEREETIERLRIPLAEELRTAGLTGFEITGRPKNLWSIYKKMKKRDKPFEEIYDLLAVRVLVNDIPECYHVLGVIHHKWTPLQEPRGRKASAEGGDAYRLCVRGAHGGRAALSGCGHQRPHRAVAPSAQERRHGGGDDRPAGQAAPRLARPRADRPCPPQDPAMDQPGRAREEPRARAGDPRAGSAAAASRAAGCRASGARRDRALRRDGGAAAGRAGAGRHRAGDHDAGAVPRPPGRGPPGAQADGVRPRDRAPAARPRDQDPGGGRADGAVRPVLS